MRFNQNIALILVVTGGLLAGCGSGNSPISADQESLKKATDMRALYTKTNGDYNSLSPEEKARFKTDIAQGLDPEKAWQNLAPQKANMAGSRPTAGDPRG